MVRAARAHQEVPNIVDPSYRRRRQSTSPSPSLRGSPPRQIGSDSWPRHKHDPDFRPFAGHSYSLSMPVASPVSHDEVRLVPRALTLRHGSSVSSLYGASLAQYHRDRMRHRPSSASTSPAELYSPSRRSSVDSSFLPHTPSSSPLLPTPTKEEREAARNELDPELRRALRLHEREIERTQRQYEGRKLVRRSRRRTTSAPPSPSTLSRDGFNFDGSALDERDPEEEASLLWSPPAMLSDLASEDDCDSDTQTCTDEPDSQQRRSSTGDALRRQFVGLSLKVDLAVFRAKRSLKNRVGLV